MRKLQKLLNVLCERRGRYAVLRPVVRGAVASGRRAREATLGVRGVDIFNLLPATLRSILIVFYKQLLTNQPWLDWEEQPNLTV